MNRQAPNLNQKYFQAKITKPCYEATAGLTGESHQAKKIWEEYRDKLHGLATSLPEGTPQKMVNRILDYVLEKMPATRGKSFKVGNITLVQYREQLEAVWVDAQLWAGR